MGGGNGVAAASVRLPPVPDKDDNIIVRGCPDNGDDVGFSEGDGPGGVEVWAKKIERYYW